MLIYTCWGLAQCLIPLGSAIGVRQGNGSLSTMVTITRSSKYTNTLYHWVISILNPNLQPALKGLGFLQALTDTQDSNSPEHCPGAGEQSKPREGRESRLSCPATCQGVRKTPFHPPIPLPFTNHPERWGEEGDSAMTSKR